MNYVICKKCVSPFIMFILAFYNLLTFFTFRNWYVTGFLVQRDRDPWLIISYFVNGHAIIILQTTTYPRNSPSTYQNFIKLLEMWILHLSFTFYHYHDYHGQWCIKIKHGLVRQKNCKFVYCFMSSWFSLKEEEDIKTSVEKKSLKNLQ